MGPGMVWANYTWQQTHAVSHAYNAKEMPAALMGGACHVRNCAGGAMGSKECGRASKREQLGPVGTAATHRDL